MWRSVLALDVLVAVSVAVAVAVEVLVGVCQSDVSVGLGVSVDVLRCCQPYLSMSIGRTYAVSPSMLDLFQSPSLLLSM